MFKRLDLYGSHCRTLRIIVHASLPSKVIEQAFSNSHVHVSDEEKDDQAVFYGTTYVLKGKPHSVQASVIKLEKDEVHIGFIYHAREFPQPPSDMEKVVALASILGQFPSLVEFECTGTFRYAKNNWTSLISLPAKLMQDMPPFTHTESITFSERVENQIKQSLRIRITGAGNLSHSAFVSMDGQFSDPIPVMALQETRKLSRRFVSKKSGGLE